MDIEDEDITQDVCQGDLLMIISGLATTQRLRRRKTTMSRFAGDERNHAIDSHRRNQKFQTKFSRLQNIYIFQFRSLFGIYLQSFMF